jgi:hypothetical protein
MLERKKIKQRRERKIWQSFRKTERAKTCVDGKERRWLFIIALVTALRFLRVFSMAKYTA